MPVRVSNITANFHPVILRLSIEIGPALFPCKLPLGTFNPLFPAGRYFGQGVINLNGPSNFIQVDPQVGLELTKSVMVVADYNIFWRTSLHDGVYGLATNLLVSGIGNFKRYVGSQPSVGVSWQINRHLLVSAAYDHFFAGPISGSGDAA